jgi:hypothetical protein
MVFVISGYIGVSIVPEGVNQRDENDEGQQATGQHVGGDLGADDVADAEHRRRDLERHHAPTLRRPQNSMANVAVSDQSRLMRFRQV